MYVCLCNGYRDTEIREVAETGVRSIREIYLTLGNGPCCGGCLDCAQAIVDSVHGGVEAAPAAEESPERTDEALMMAAE